MGKLIVSEPHKLVYVEVPKCASTATIKFFLDLSGIKIDTNPRKFLRNNKTELRQKAGLSRIEIANLDLDKFIIQRQDYYWFSVVRDPYSRVLSNYHNKLNRFAYKFDRISYYRGKLVQLISGPSAWGRANSATECRQKFISFEQFVHGLRDYSIQFDLHYKPQREILQPDVIPYDNLIKLDRFSEGLRELMISLKFEGSANIAKPDFQHINNSFYKSPLDSFFTEETKEIIYDLYRQDFEFLDYPR